MATAEEPKTRTGDATGTGRRKSAVARVRIRPGQGELTINGRPVEEFFCEEQDRSTALAPLKATSVGEQCTILVRVNGGGTSGQAGAVRLGIARALKEYDGETEAVLREQHLLTRDGRMKERKKYGLRGARKGTQFSKR